MPRNELPPIRTDYPPWAILWAIGKWGAFGIALVLAFLAMTEHDSNKAVMTAFLSVLCAVASRLAQSEEHKAASGGGTR